MNGSAVHGRPRLLGVGAVLALSLACGSTSRPVADAIRVERGPRVLELDGDPNGLWWDANAETLLVTDDGGNRILEWSDSRGFGTHAPLPEDSLAGAGLGQLVRVDGGDLVVTRFGVGTEGGVTIVPLQGDVRNVPGLDVTRQRVGLAKAADGTLYDSWFVRLDSGERVGAVGQLSLDGSEPEVMTGLTNPVGVLALGDRLFVSDQDTDQIRVASRMDPASVTVFTSLEQPDLLAEGPAGSIFSGSATGRVYRIDSAGVASEFQAGFRQVRGVAYDPAGQRLFVAEHDPAEPGLAQHALHILPVN
jgi:DNA-binding beta-propeller fold protein YncE